MNIAARLMLSEPDVHPDARAPVLAFVCDPETRAVLDTVGGAAGWSPRAVRDGGIGAALNDLATIPTPHLLVLDVSESADPVGDIGGLAALCDAGTRVLAVGASNDARLFRALRQAGVDDYLVKPLDAAALNEAIDEALAARDATPEPQPDSPDGEPAVAVVGVRGGVGASLIAVNAAWQAAEPAARRIALLDLDFHFGSVALMLDREPGPGLRDALLNPGRIDDLFLERAATRVGDHLSLFGAELALDEAFDGSAAGVPSLLDRLKEGFDGVVLDLPRALLVSQPEIAGSLSAIVLVSDLSLAGMRDCIRLSALIAAIAPDLACRLVITRVGEFPKAEVDPETFAKGVGLPISALVPYDAKLAAKAAQQGRALVDLQPRGKFAQAVAATSRLLEDRKNASPQKGSWFARLWR